MSVATRACPRCPGSSLVDYEAETGVTVDFCSDCRGIWCDRDELDRLLGDGADAGLFPLPFDDGESGGAGPVCPACPPSHRARLQPRPLPLDESSEAPLPIVLHDCLDCGGIWLDGGCLARLQEVARRRALARGRRERPLRRQSASPPAEAKPAAARFSQQLPYEVPLVDLVALPSSVLVALALNLTPARVLLYPFQIVVHELGHAVTAWLSGRLAVPLPMGITFWGPPNLLVKLVVLAAIGALGVLAWRECRLFVVGLALALLVLHLSLAWLFEPSLAEMWISFAGIAGELLISAGLLVAFYYRAPDRLRWDFWRYVALLPAACAFTLQALLWWRAGEDPSQIPLGSALAATRDGSGDLEKLIDLHGWTTTGIIDAYQGLALLCGASVAAHYVFFAPRAVRSLLSPAPVR